MAGRWIAVLCVELRHARAGLAAVCRRSASTRDSPAPTSTARWRLGAVTFCDNRSFSPSRRTSRRPILEQIDDGIRRLKWRYNCDHFIGYFQPATNTYAPADRLRERYERPFRTHASSAWRTALARLRLERSAGPAVRVCGANLALGRVRHADDARSLAGLDESRASPRLHGGCDGAIPRPRL